MGNRAAKVDRSTQTDELQTNNTATQTEIPRLVTDQLPDYSEGHHQRVWDREEEVPLLARQSCETGTQNPAEWQVAVARLRTLAGTNQLTHRERRSRQHPITANSLNRALLHHSYYISKPDKVLKDLRFLFNVWHHYQCDAGVSSSAFSEAQGRYIRGIVKRINEVNQTSSLSFPGTVSSTRVCEIEGWVDLTCSTLPPAW